MHIEGVVSARAGRARRTRFSAYKWSRCNCWGFFFSREVVEVVVVVLTVVVCMPMITNCEMVDVVVLINMHIDGVINMLINMHSSSRIKTKKEQCDSASTRMVIVMLQVRTSSIKTDA
eukprot:g10402.t1